MITKTQLPDIEKLKNTFNSLEKLQNSRKNKKIQNSWDDAVKTSKIDVLQALIAAKINALANEPKQKMRMRNLTDILEETSEDETSEDEASEDEEPKPALAKLGLQRQKQYNFRENSKHTSNYTGEQGQRQTKEQELADIEKLKNAFNSLEKLHNHVYNETLQKYWDDAVNNKSAFSNRKDYNTIDFLKFLIKKKTNALAEEQTKEQELADIEKLKNAFNSLEKLHNHVYNETLQKYWDDAVNNKSAFSNRKDYNTIDFLKFLITKKTNALAEEAYSKHTSTTLTKKVEQIQNPDQHINDMSFDSQDIQNLITALNQDSQANVIESKQPDLLKKIMVACGNEEEQINEQIINNLNSAVEVLKIKQVDLDYQFALKLQAEENQGSQKSLESGKSHVERLFKQNSIRDESRNNMPNPMD